MFCERQIDSTRFSLSDIRHFVDLTHVCVATKGRNGKFDQVSSIRSVRSVQS